MGSNNRTLIALVQDKPGVLARIAGLIRRRGFNIDSLAVGASERKGFSRMTFVVRGNQKSIDRASGILERLVEVIEVQDVTAQNFVWRELALIKVKADSKVRSEIVEIGNIFRARVVDIGIDALTFEIAGGRTKADALVALLRKYEILEVVRTGRIATLRSAIDKESADGDFYANESKHLERDYGSGSI